MRAVEIFVVLLAACGQACVPSPNPSPIPPDATDAAPVVLDGTTPCQAACLNMAALCGPQPTDCPSVFAHVDGARLIRTPSGAALTCMAIAGAASRADVAALGVACP